MKNTGVKIPGFKLSKDGKIEDDVRAQLKKLPVNKQIAVKASKKIRVASPSSARSFKRSGR